MSFTATNVFRLKVKKFLFILLEKKMSPNITGNCFFCVQMNSDLNQHLNGLQSWIANCSWNEHCFAGSLVWKTIVFFPTNTENTWLGGWVFFFFWLFFYNRPIFVWINELTQESSRGPDGTVAFPGREGRSAGLIIVGISGWCGWCLRRRPWPYY